MSSDGSPSLLNLRGFRMLKKPSFSHSPQESQNITTPRAMASNNIKPARRRILEVTDSDSDEVNGIYSPSSKKKLPQIKQESPKNVSTSPLKSTSFMTSAKSSLVTSPTSTSTSCTDSTPISKMCLALTPTTTPEEKKRIVSIREKLVRYLMFGFPNVQSFEIYESLSKTQFVLEEALKRLKEKHPPREGLKDFETWNAEEEKDTTASSPVVVVPPKQSNLQQKIQFQKSTIVQKMNETVTVSLKRKEPSSSSDPTFVKKVKRKKAHHGRDSDDSTENNYGISQVYDSDDDSDAEVSNVLTNDKKRVLEFLQDATPAELQLMASCSKKKVDAILACRPFENWVDLVQKIHEHKFLSTDLLNYAQRVIMTRNNVKQLMKKCTSLSQQLQQAINTSPGVKQQPALLSQDLRLTNYQLVGLNWLVVLHNQGLNGILADEMGLGKTIQVISFLAHLKETNAAKNTHLVVVPSSTLENWQNEFERWCPSLRVLLYYGSCEERRSFRILFAQGEHKEFDIILTTYTMVNSGPEERKMFRITPIHYVIFDEAHMLKNMNTLRYESLVRIKAANRILLTGTPLQNNLLELMSLLIFVMPNIFSEKTEDLKNLFQKNSKASRENDDQLPVFEREQIDQAKRIMKPFLLRRLKKDVLQDLPKKTDVMLRVPLVPSQEEQYKDLVASFKAAGDNNVGYNGVTMMTDLRKLSNHPLLLRYHYQYEDLTIMAKRLAKDDLYKDTVEQYIIDDLAYMSDFAIHTMTKEYPCLSDFALPNSLITTSGKFLYLDTKLDDLKKNGHRVLIFSQYVILLNILEEYMKIRKHSYLRLDGSTAVNIRQQLIDEFTEDPNIFVFLLSTKAGGLGINLTAADTVIIHDIDFNPYNDKQAEDRCHRMGQKNPVSVFRLVSQGTIEEGMWQLTQEKLKLEKEITTEVNETTDLKSVVSLLSTSLGIDVNKATNLVSPNKNL